MANEPETNPIAPNLGGGAPAPATSPAPEPGSVSPLAEPAPEPRDWGQAVLRDVMDRRAKLLVVSRDATAAFKVARGIAAEMEAVFLTDAFVTGEDRAQHRQALVELIKAAPHIRLVVASDIQAVDLGDARKAVILSVEPFAELKGGQEVFLHAGVPDDSAPLWAKRKGEAGDGFATPGGQ